MNLFLKKARRVLAARLVLCTLMFGVLGGYVSLVCNLGSQKSVTVVYAKETEPPSYDQQMQDAQTQMFSPTPVPTGKTKSDLEKLTENVKPKANGLTEMVTWPVMQILNAVIFIALALINTYFFVQTCFDIAFLLAPAFRDVLSRNQNSDDGSGKAARFVNGLISEPALNAVGYNKTGEKGHIECGEMAAEVDWKGWLVKRLFMFICLMAYLSLLMLGLLPQFINLFTQIGYAIVKALMDLISPKTTP